MLAFIVLALIASAARRPPAIELEVETVYAEHLGLQTALDSPLGIEESDKVETPTISPPNLMEVDDPFAAPAKIEIRPSGVTATVAASDMKTAAIGLALSGRQEGSRRNLLGRYGGNDTTEAAVERGLEWLARNQLGSGAWSLMGPYRDASDMENPEAATAMALIAFQGAGNTHQSGKWRERVARAWAWLLQQQTAQGDFFHEGGFNHRFYTQGQCTIALCELYGMTKDPKFQAPAYRAVQYCVNTQGPDGGWRYSPNAEGDVSVTGWIVMALESARMAGIDVPPMTFRRVGQFLDRLGTQGGSRYSYQLGKPATLSMTAEGMLCRQWLGWPRDDKRLVLACKWIVQPENLVNFRRERDVYYWYYATQLCHHMEGEYWRKWNAVMRQAVPEHQVLRGSESGSWDPLRPTEDKWATLGGRLYTTCLSIYMLEVYYRHLPIYANAYALDTTAIPASRSAKPATESKPSAEEPKPGAKPKS